MGNYAPIRNSDANLKPCCSFIVTRTNKSSPVKCLTKGDAGIKIGKLEVGGSETTNFK